MRVTVCHLSLFLSLALSLRCALNVIMVPKALFYYLCYYLWFHSSGLCLDGVCVYKWVFVWVILSGSLTPALEAALHTGNRWHWVTRRVRHDRHFASGAGRFRSDTVMALLSQLFYSCKCEMTWTASRWVASMYFTLLNSVLRATWSHNWTFVAFSSRLLALRPSVC